MYLSFEMSKIIELWNLLSNCWEDLDLISLYANIYSEISDFC